MPKIVKIMVLNFLLFFPLSIIIRGFISTDGTGLIITGVLLQIVGIYLMFRLYARGFF